MSKRAILIALQSGPHTNAQLQDAVCDHGGAVARDCSKLIRAGQIVRVDGASGRGSRAIYARAY